MTKDEKMVLKLIIQAVFAVLVIYGSIYGFAKAIEIASQL